MDEMKDLKQRLSEHRPQPWDAMPDLGLYMDQIIAYMSRQMIHYGEAEGLTSAMVNNYIKDGMLPRAEGKRYSRIHLGYLTAICALKKVLSVKNTSRLILTGSEGHEPEPLYAHFLQSLDGALTETAESLDASIPDKDLPSLALNLALRSYANQLACERILDIIDLQRQEVTRPTSEKKESKKTSR